MSLGMRLRHCVHEIMDDQDLDQGSHLRALRGLGRINRVSRSVACLWQPIARAARMAGGRTLRVLDLASGGGDVARGIARSAKTAGLPIEVHGADFSEKAIEFASGRARDEGLNVEFFKLDALADSIPPDYDILTCTLFLHHLSEKDASSLLGKMAASARQMVLVDDLIRSRAGYVIAWAGCRLLTRSKVVHHDAPVSVSGAFRVKEVRAMAEAAGLSGAMIRTHWPERFLLSWSRT
jgi:2-polyprenyl-3-methyl-5-hydroxy-6-metoxy-1,4-benzoquinol methylase